MDIRHKLTALLLPFALLLSFLASATAHAAQLLAGVAKVDSPTARRGSSPSWPATPTATSTTCPPRRSGRTPATPRKTATASWSPEGRKIFDERGDALLEKRAK